MNAIEMRDVSKQYDDFALESLSLSLPSGSILGLVGENGAGKSTTIKLIMNAIRRDSGTVSVLGCDNQSAAFSDAKEDIGIVLDEAYFPEMMTAKNLEKVMRCTYRNWDSTRYEDYRKKFRLAEKKAFKDYSRGMKMKLAIAVALSHAPKLLILDEATSGLDPIVRDEILDIFNEFTRDPSHSILISSHIVSDLEKICDYIAFLHNGRLVICEEKDRLLEEYAVVHLPESDLAALPKDAILGKKVGNYGTEALVAKSKVPAALPTEHTTLEEIIVYLARGGRAE